MNNLLTLTRLRELLKYEPTTGLFRWRLGGRGTGGGGSVAGTTTGDYAVICVDGLHYRANRLAWFYMTGEWPSGVVDHIDTNPRNDRWLNLRDVTHQVNLQNMRDPGVRNKSGFLGVSWHQHTGRWRASISLNNKAKHLGLFSTAPEAASAYVEAKRVHHAGCTL